MGHAAQQWADMCACTVGIRCAFGIKQTFLSGPRALVCPVRAGVPRKERFILAQKTALRKAGGETARQKRGACRKRPGSGRL